MTRFLALVLFMATACAAPAAAQEPPPPPPAAEQTPPAAQTPPADQTPPAKDAPPQTRVMNADAGLIFFPVKPERTGDFEKIVAKLKDALTGANDPVRRQQAQGWKVFRAVEPGPNSTALYVFVIDPAVKGSDYAFWKAMYDELPAEVQELYRLYTAASGGGQTLLNLQLVADFRSPQEQ